MKRILFCFFLCSVLSISFTGINISAAADLDANKIKDIKAKAYVLIDAQTGAVIASENRNKKLPMASTTKIMSTLLLLESGEREGDIDSEFVVDSEAIKVEGSTMGLCEGDIVTKRALCYGMMLPSGNDAANASAVKTAGDYESFSEMMNSRALKIGMNNTNFVTPSGLDAYGHYSTAYDMALLTREALNNEIFREICGLKSAKLKFGSPPYSRWLSNSNKMLSLYPGCIGVKTGFTDEAGRCLVSAAEKDGITLICVTLNCPDDWNAHMKLFDYGFTKARKTPIPVPLDNIFIDVVGGDADTAVLGYADEPFYTVINDKAPEITVKKMLPRFIYAPVKTGDTVGKAMYFAGDEMIDEVDIIAVNDCKAVVKKHKKSLYYIIIDKLKEIWK